MNNVSRLLLARAEKAERVLATMVKANDIIESICDDEIGKLKARVAELEAVIEEGKNQEDWDAQVDEEASEKESRRLQAYDREQFYRDLDEQNGEVPTF